MYEDIVEFYKHLTLQRNSLFSRVQGSTICINASVLENVFGLKGTVTELPYVSTPAMLESLHYDYSVEPTKGRSYRRKNGFKNEIQFIVDLFNRAFLCVTTGRGHIRQDAITLLVL